MKPPALVVAVSRFRAFVVSSVALAALANVGLADEVKLATGETLKGTIVSQDAATTVLDHPVLGRLTIPAAHIAPPAPAPEPPPAWKVKAELGASGTRGNNDQSDLHAAISALHETESGRIKASAGWATSETDGDKTKDQKFVEGTYDFLFQDSPWSAFATGRLDWDEFQDWDRRASVGLGAGYEVVKAKDVSLRLRAGLAETREWGGSDPDREDWRLEGLLGAELTWTLNDVHSIEAKSTWYPDLEDAGEYRLLSSASWSIRLSRSSSISLKLGVEDEYDTHNEDPFEKNDFRYFVALLVEF